MHYALPAGEIPQASVALLRPDLPSWIIVQATAMRLLSSNSLAQPKSKSKSLALAPPDTGSGVRPHRALEASGQPLSPGFKL
jgi:hypothetical protein